MPLPSWLKKGIQQESCNNTLKVISLCCLFGAVICLWGAFIAQLHTLHKWCWLRDFITGMLKLYVHIYILCFIMKKQNQHANGRSNIQSIHCFHEKIKCVFTPCHFQKTTFRCASLNIANVKRDCRNIHFWLNHQLLISINISGPAERLCYAVLELFRFASLPLPCRSLQWLPSEGQGWTEEPQELINLLELFWFYIWDIPTIRCN